MTTTQRAVPWLLLGAIILVMGLGVVAKAEACDTRCEKRVAANKAAEEEDGNQVLVGFQCWEDSVQQYFFEFFIRYPSGEIGTSTYVAGLEKQHARILSGVTKGWYCVKIPQEIMMRPTGRGT